jgi:membrane protease YdiL (CAAX protease family)
MKLLTILKNTYFSRPISLYLLFTFVISWSFILLFSLGQAKLIGFQLPKLFLILFAQFGPLLSVLFLVGFCEGKQKLKNIYKRIININVGLSWFLFVIFLYPIIFSISFSINYLLKGDMPDFPNNGGWMLLVGNFVLMLIVGLIFGGLSEEIGWRGIMLTKLQNFASPLMASFIIATFWSLWHLEPDFLVELFTNGWHAFLVKAIPIFGKRFLETLPLTIIMTYIFNRTNGNLLLMIIIHSASNAAISSLPILWTKTPSILVDSYLIIIWILAIGIYFATKLLSRDKKKYTDKLVRKLQE